MELVIIVLNGLAYLSLLIGVVLAALAPSGPAFAAEAAAGTVFETSFTTSKPYANPFVDVDVDVVFTSGATGSQSRPRRLPA